MWKPEGLQLGTVGDKLAPNTLKAIWQMDTLMSETWNTWSTVLDMITFSCVYAESLSIPLLPSYLPFLSPRPGCQTRCWSMNRQQVDQWLERASLGKTWCQVELILFPHSGSTPACGFKRRFWHGWELCDIHCECSTVSFFGKTFLVLTI